MVGGHGGSRQNSGRKRKTSSMLKEEYKDHLALCNPYDPRKKNAQRLVEEAERFEAEKKAEVKKKQDSDKKKREDKTLKDKEEGEKKKQHRILENAQQQIVFDNGLRCLAEAAENFRTRNTQTTTSRS